MFERFTDRARRSLVRAQENAIAFGHGFLGCEHILLGLAIEGEGVAAVALRQFDVDVAKVRDAIVERIGEAAPSQISDADALRSLGIDLAAIQERLEATFGEGALAARDPARPPFTTKAKALLELAVQESELLQHGYVGTEHLLLALLRVEGNVGLQILEGAGVSSSDLREAVLDLAAKDYQRVRRAELKLDRLTALARDPQNAALLSLYNEAIRDVLEARRAHWNGRRALTQALADDLERLTSEIEAKAAQLGHSLS